MRKYQSITIVLLLLCIVGCSTGHRYEVLSIKPPTDVPDDKALVYFFTPPIGLSLYYTVFEDGKPIGMAKHNTYFTYYTTPGRHIYEGKTEFKSSLETNLQAGKVYYIKCTAVPGFIIGNPRIKDSNKEEFDKYLNNMKYIKTNEEDLAKSKL